MLMRQTEQNSVKRQWVILNKKKLEFFRALTVLQLWYGCTIWIFGEKLDGNYERILRTVLKFLEAASHKEQLNVLISISQTIQLSWTRHAVHW